MRIIKARQGFAISELKSGDHVQGGSSGKMTIESVNKNANSFCTKYEGGVGGPICGYENLGDGRMFVPCSAFTPCDGRIVEPHTITVVDDLTIRDQFQQRDQIWILTSINGVSSTEIRVTLTNKETSQSTLFTIPFDQEHTLVIKDYIPIP